MNSLELLLHIVIHPHYALKAKDKPLVVAIVASVMAILSSSLGNLLATGTSVGGKVFFFGIALKVLLLLVFWFLAVSIWHLVAEGFRGKGRVLELFPSMGICLFPAVFLCPLALLMGPFGHMATEFYPLLKSIILIWIIALQILSLKIVYEISGGLAALSYFTPFFALLALVVLIGVFSILLLLLLMSKTAMGFLPLLNSLPGS